VDDSLGRDDEEGLLPSRPDSPSDYPEELIEEAEARARISTLQRDELLTQSKIFREGDFASRERSGPAFRSRVLRNETWSGFIAERR